MHTRFGPRSVDVISPVLLFPLPCTIHTAVHLIRLQFTKAASNDYPYYVSRIVEFAIPQDLLRHSYITLLDPAGRSRSAHRHLPVWSVSLRPYAFIYSLGLSPSRCHSYLSVSFLFLSPPFGLSFMSWPIYVDLCLLLVAEVGQVSVYVILGHTGARKTGDIVLSSCARKPTKTQHAGGKESGDEIHIRSNTRMSGG